MLPFLRRAQMAQRVLTPYIAHGRGFIRDGFDAVDVGLPV